MKSGKFLSACLIVRNEEKNLERCLKSIQKLVDEIVVIDTGSTDDTIKIAKRFAARVYSHPWQNDFSFHRNQAIDYAEGEWLMVIDADEEFCLSEGVSYAGVRDFIEKTKKYNAVALTLRDIQKGREIMQFSTVRFFRKGWIHYEGIVHNQAKLKDDGDAQMCPFVTLKHYGYDLTPEQKKAKFERTSTLLQKQIETGEMIDMLPYFFLGQLYADSGMPKEAAEWNEKYWSVREKIPKGHFCDAIYFSTVKQYMRIGNREKANEWLMRGLEALEGDVDMAMVALEYGVWVKDEELMLQAAKDYLTLYTQYEKNPTLKANRFIYSLRPEAKSYALFHLTATMFKQGGEALSMLLGLLEKSRPAYRDGMMRELEKSLGECRFPIRFKTSSEAAFEDDNFSEGAPELTTMQLQ